MIKQRIFPAYNYNAIWFDLKTIRLGIGIARELPPERAEFYDVGINTKCNANCEFCYVSASKTGRNFKNICNTWIKWMETYPQDVIEKSKIKTEKPFQIAIGSTGEPTLHPELADFLKTVYETNVIPNYTTNGSVLADEKGEFLDTTIRQKLLEFTEKYVGGVAISTANPFFQKAWRIAANIILEMKNIKLNLHHIIEDKKSVDAFLTIHKEYPTTYYHVLLPLMKSGRSNRSMTQETWDYLEQKILENKIENVAFGAHFIKYLENSSIKTWLYPPESLSKNIILEENCVKITPSSFNLTPMKIINL